MQFILDLKKKLQEGLPGSQSQVEMAPLGRAEYAASVSDYKKAAVLCLLYPKSGAWKMVFIQRAFHEKDKHSAQIAFPGGKMEDDDRSFEETALREANEEIGIDPRDINVLGPLTPLKIPVSRFIVHPILAFMDYEPTFLLQESEVERIIEVSIEDLMDSRKKTQGPVQLSNGIELNVPLFDFDGTIIWGATSMMLNEIIHLLRA